MNKRKQKTMSVGEEAAEKISEAFGFPVIDDAEQMGQVASIIDRIVAERGSTNSVANSSKLVGEPAGASQPQDQPSTETGLAPCPFCGGKMIHNGSYVYHPDPSSSPRPFCIIGGGSFPLRNWEARVSLISSLSNEVHGHSEKTKEAIKRLKRWIAEGNPCTEVNDDILTVCNFAEEEKENE